MLRILLSFLLSLPVLLLIPTDGSSEPQPTDEPGFTQGMERAGWRGMGASAPRIGGTLRGFFVDTTPSFDELQDRLSGARPLGLSIAIDLGPPLVTQLRDAETSSSSLVLFHSADVRVLPMP